MKCVKKNLSLAIAIRVQIIVKIPILVHIVNVRPVELSALDDGQSNGIYRPYGLKWNPEVLVIINYFLQLRPIGISPPALVITERKVLLHRGEADGTLLPRRRDLCLRRTSVHIKIDTST